MAGKWTLLQDALSIVAARVGGAEQAQTEIAQVLKRGELAACAEQYSDAWIHRKDPIHRAVGDNGYRAVRRAARQMLPIAKDWWELCEVDFAKNTAHVRWASDDIAKIGDTDPFHVHVDGVLVSAADIERLWPAPKPRLATSRRTNVTTLPRKRGPKAATFDRVLNAMRASGGYANVQEWTEEAMKAEFGASRETCRKARDLLQSEYVGNSERV